MEGLEERATLSAELTSRGIFDLAGRFSWSSPWVVLAFLASLHFLVDLTAGITSPVWPSLEQAMARPSGGLLWVYVCWSVATSMGQLAIGYWADGRPSRWLIWLGPLVGILCVNCIGLVETPLALAGLLFAGGLGIAAFHPEAATMAGGLSPEHRSRCMAIFALCGYLGQAAGPIYCGLIDERYGLPSLAFGIGWSVPLLFVMAIGLFWTSANWNLTSHFATQHARTTTAESQQPFPLMTVLTLLAVGAFRILPALGVPLALAYLLNETDASTSAIGAVQSAFMAGIGIGALACAAFLRSEWERTSLWLFPLLSAPLLLLIAVANGWPLVMLVGLCGFLLGVTLPVFISYGQQLLPQSQRVASSITMGVSWGIASGMVAAAMWLLTQAGMLSLIFWIFAGSSVFSSLLCMFLPNTNSR